MDVLDRIPGDSRTQIGFIAYDSSVHFFNLAEGLSQPQMLTVTDVDGQYIFILLILVLSKEILKAIDALFKVVEDTPMF
jgi:protein transport protein SEC24